VVNATSSQVQSDVYEVRPAQELVPTMAREKTSTRFEEMDRLALPLATVAHHYFTACRTEGKTAKTLRGYNEKLGRFLRRWFKAILPSGERGRTIDEPPGISRSRSGL